MRSTMTKVIVITGILAMATFCLEAQAQSVVKQVFGKKADDAVRTVAPVVAPVTTVIIDVSKGSKPDDAVKSVTTKKLQVMSIVPDTQVKVDQMIEDAVKQNLPPDLGKAIEIIRLPEKLRKQLDVQVIRTTESLLKDGRIPDLASLPLAAALHQAHELYAGRAKPIPSGVSLLLKTSFSKQTLSNAKYVIDDNLGSLPSIINRIQEQLSSDNHAVAIDDIIVFSKDPGTDAIFFWAHEIQHTAQYHELGIEGFATKYIENHQALEDDADNKAKEAVAKASVILEFVQASMEDRQAK